MSKKYYMICRFETKDDFDKHFKSIYDSGYAEGFEKGVATGLSLVYELLHSIDPKILNEAKWIASEREKTNAMKRIQDYEKKRKEEGESKWQQKAKRNL